MAGAVFTVVTAEMMPVGLLTPMGAALSVTEGTAGLALTVTGLVSAVTAPILPLALGRLDRRVVLVTLMALLGLATLLAAVATSFAVLMVARVLTGISLGGVWLLTVGLAARLVPERSVGPASSLIFSGIGIASVLGIPAGTYLGEFAGWRWAFAAVGVVAFVLAAALAVTLPKLPAATAVRRCDVGDALRDRRIRVGLVLVALLVTAHFSAYTYVRPLLETLADLQPALIGTLLLAYGVAGVAGNFAAGATRSPRRALLLIAIGLTLAVPALAILGTTIPGALVLLVFWGLAYGGVTVSTQNWQRAATPRSTEAAAALLVGVFNGAIGLGALTGGRVVDAIGPTAVPWLTGALALTALLVLATSRSTNPQRTAARDHTGGG
ncbi:putative MFS family arabinose efflux permease [Kribbella amoyensis]|uniref:Putative MFS family arabinose efflux permease n=1 Tax=Kribbella amoyensis TaxID=996641 RepID=A0A561BK56_9ACTN|nr:MFS transporter [Kribbella amoyensis]TWD79257.1 putative MFS family arabinose efflux permease [Kribbella amoyensis]